MSFSRLFDPVSKLMEGAVLYYIGNVLVNLLVDLVYRLVNPWMR
jgi:ABC-type dipeptide/oligopeptide/nickel transport system permease component